MFIKTVYPSALGQKIPFSSCVDDAIAAGFSGFWFEPSLDFNISREEMLSLIQLKHILPMGMELPVEFRKDEETFSHDLKRLESIAAYASFIGIRRAVTWIVPSHDILPFQDNFHLHVERLRAILDVLDRYSIRLGLEFQGPKSLRKEKRYWFVHTLDGIMSLIAAIDRRNCGILMDSWHWELSGAENFDFNQFSNGSLVVCVHVNDAPLDIREEDFDDLSRCLPGSTGRLGLGDFIAGLRGIGYSGPVIAEPFDSSLGSLSTAEAFKKVSLSIDKVL